MDQEGMLENIKNEPVWNTYRDPETLEVLFYNRVTKISQPNRPEDFDGYYVIGDHQSEAQKTKSDEQTNYERTFGDMGKRFCTPMELAKQPYLPITDTSQPAPAGEDNGMHMIGQWEEVRYEDQFENIRKAEMKKEEEEAQLKRNRSGTFDSEKADDNDEVDKEE